MSKSGKRIGVVLLNLGGPTSEPAVRSFLENLFGDQDIINIGGGRFQSRLAKIIAKFRYKGVAEKYRDINACPEGCRGSKYCPNRQNKVVSDCCSPINSLTELQRRELEKMLKNSWPDHFVKVYTAMRYWVPFDYDVFEEAVNDDIEHLVLLPLYPQFSYTTTGSSFRNWETIRNSRPAGSKQPGWQEYLVGQYHLNPSYLSALNQRIDERLREDFTEKERSKVHLVFTAHGTPLSEVKKGDPYTQHIEETVDAIMKMRNYHETHWLGYQSRVGPSKWTQPNTEDLVFRLIDYGIKHMILIPVAFVTDHIETAHELDIELREELEEQNKHVDKLVVSKGLNDHPDFLAALQDEISKKIQHITGTSEQPEKTRQSLSVS
ncbi:ferrochelatase [Natronogracilivirga saccharolytica]|uniref:Ferrochelatase n=1 Tax=Natronogracilivirga saccharolytica TaxID=2812953 RepID=A0A8J7UXK6_9BACT|nr:ferrochelatase [Natronogracilivirga saccharolytica]MBP3193434.1 ferrochelatase [Natronogracilivirga saccharolytica]